MKASSITAKGWVFIHFRERKTPFTQEKGERNLDNREGKGRIGRERRVRLVGKENQS